MHRHDAELGLDVNAGTEVSRRAVVGTAMAAGVLLLSGCKAKSGTSDAASKASAGAVVKPVAPVTPYIAPPAAAASSAGLTIVPRSTWTGKGVARPNEIYPINGVRRMTVHHDGMAPVSLRTQTEIARRIEQIRSSHVNGRGWADIGYHFIIDPTGRVWEGRNVRYQGAHVKDQNENNLGVLVLGNFERQSPTSQACATLDRFLAQRMAMYRVSLGSVCTHRELAPTQCPGSNLQAYMSRTRSRGGRLAMLCVENGIALA